MTDLDDLAALDAVAQAELVRAGTATPLDLVDAAIARVEKLNGELNAVIHPLYDEARERAAGPLPDGPFRGVPVLFKDLRCAVEGHPYHEGTRLAAAAGWRARHTDNLAQRYLDAGFVCIGRTNTPEFGLVPTTEPLAYGPTRNPWDLTRTTGGSSGGSAAAVASRMVPLAHANDGGGSIRIPASACGLVGLKPSRGRTSLGPHGSPILELLTSELAVTRTVRDTAAVLDALQGPFPGDTVMAPTPARPFSAEVGADAGRLRIAILTHDPHGGAEIHPDCIAATEDAARLLESLGHTVEAAFPPAVADPLIAGYFTALWSSELTASVRAWEQRVGRESASGDLEPLTEALAEMGAGTTASSYIEAKQACHRLTRDVASWQIEHRFDLVLTPTVGEPPPPLGTFHTPDEPFLGFIRAASFVPFTPLANITGQPAISLPLAWNDEGLPIGVHLIAAYGREDLLLRVAAQCEQARPWVDRLPPVHA